MKNPYSIAALFLVFFLFSCSKEESLLQSPEMAPLYQHWALDFDNDIVTGVPYDLKYPDASEKTEGYMFFENGKGVDYGYTPQALFTYEINKNGTDKILVINKSIPVIQPNNNHNEGGCNNNLSNGSGCNNTENFNATPEMSVGYEATTESFRIEQLTQSSLQGYRLN